MHPLRIAAAVAAVLAIAPAAAEAASAPVTVMTRNIYLGGDIYRPVKAVSGKSGLEALVAFGNANHELRQVIDRTSFPTRSKLLAAEILTRKPDLVGLQEVALWRSGPYDLNAVLTGRKVATKVDYDFLETLLEDLKGRYRAVVVKREADVEGPVFSGPSPGADAQNARLTMYDVVLHRKASRVKIVGKGSKSYKAIYSVSVQGATFAFTRGYGYVDARIGRKRFRFINTHLESALSTVANDQAGELLAGPVKGAGRKPVIVACDCNSDPLDTSTKPYDVPHLTAYRTLTSQLADQWLRVKGAGPGNTSGLSELVNDPDTSGIDHRIDLILGRDAKRKALKADKGWIVGTSRRSKSGLWASDHAGVAIRLRLP